MRRNEAGLTLIELLVAVTILAIGTLVALQVYDSARRSYKVGNDLSHQQQLARVTFDLVARDLRLAGFNTNPDGADDRPDEQIEAALATAIAIRADFDAEDPALSAVPETTLAGGAFSSVSTGNDEIRIYALQKPDGSSADTLSFAADVVPASRDGVVETIDMPALDLAQNDLPYTLYRMTLNNDPAQFGGPGFVNKTVIAENVRSLRFRYLDATGAEIAPPGGADTPAAISARRAIHSIAVSIDILTADPDPSYNDPNDALASTRSFRKLELASRVTPRDLRRRGIRDLVADTTIPLAPGTPDLYPGHCGGLYVDWPPCDASEGVAYYRIYVGTDPFQLVRQRYTQMPGLYFGGLSDDTFYYIGIQAVDESGNPSAMSPTSTIRTENTTVPISPPDLSASMDQTGEIDVQWSSVAENVSATTGDPLSPMLRDGAGYRLYRSDLTGFPSTLLADENELRLTDTPQFVDRRVVGCKTYQYRVSAVDECGVESAISSSEAGRAEPFGEPRQPSTVTAHYQSPNSIRLRWTSPDFDIYDNPIYVERFNIYRTGFLPDGVNPTVPDDFTFLTMVDVSSSGREYEELVSVPPGEAVWYMVRTTDECSPAHESAPSDVASPNCMFRGNVTFVNPVEGATESGDVPFRVEVVGALSTFEEMRLTITSRIDGSVRSATVSQIGTVWDYVWETSNDPTFLPGSYSVKAEVDRRVDPLTVCTSMASLIFDVN